MCTNSSSTGPLRRRPQCSGPSAMGAQRTRHLPPLSVEDDPMYGPAVRCKRFSSSCLIAVLHQCIRPSIGACLLRAIMDIGAHAISLPDRPRLGHLGHQCLHAPGRPIFHLVSSSRRPRQVSRIDLATSSRAPHVASPCDVGMRIRQTGHQADWAAATSTFLTSKARPRARTLQAIRASLLASAIAGTLWCSRFLAACWPG